MIRRAAYDGPLGPLTLTERDGWIVALDWRAEAGAGSPVLDEALRQLDAYFARRRTVFDLPLAFSGGRNGRVQRAMAAIPYGATRTYGDLARDLGVPAQAVG